MYEVTVLLSFSKNPPSIFLEINLFLDSMEHHYESPPLTQLILA